MPSFIQFRLLLLLLAPILPCFFLPLNFKLATVLFLFLVLLLRFHTKNLFTAAYLVLILSLQFYAPNKYYTVQTIQHYDPQLGLTLDYQQGYGLHLTSILALVCFLAFLLANFKPWFKHSTIITTFVSAISFLLISVGNSLLTSPFPALSIVWAFHYAQLFLLALFTAYFLWVSPKVHLMLLSTVIFASFLIQLTSAILQFIRQASLGSVFENYQGSFYYGGLEENNALFRVNGTFAYHNQLALIFLILFILLVPVLFSRARKVFIILWSITFTVITLTQSRSILLALSLVSLLIIGQFWTPLKASLFSFGIHRLIIYSLLLLSALLPILIPRLLLSLNAFEPEAGISLRIKMLAESLTLVHTRLFTGYSPGTNEYLLFSQNPRGIISQFTASIHNGYFSLILEVGLLGLFFSILPALSIIRTYINNHGSHSSSPYYRIFFMGLVTFSLYYVFQPHSGIVEFPYLGIILGYGLYATLT